MGIWKMGPTLGSMGKPFRMPMQKEESILRELSLTLMSCSRVALVFIRRAKLSSEDLRRSFSSRTDSRISATSRCSLQAQTERADGSSVRACILEAQSQGHHTVDRLEERGVKRGSARRSSLKGRERAVIDQTNIGTVSKATLGKLLRETGWRVYGLFHHLKLN